MPQLDQLFERKRATPKAFDGAQCFEATVASVNGAGVHVTLPNFSRTLRWGPCQPSDAAVTVGDSVSVVISEDGVPWLVGAGASGGGQQGPPGPEGPEGPVGPSGPQGPKGDTGAASTVPGPAGPQGAQGVKGDTGTTGPQGAQGVKGDKGDTGATGVAGPTGPTGPQGAQGPKGDTGAMGPVGTVYDSDQIGTVKAWSGAVIPANWLLADGRALSRAGYPELFAALGGAASPWGLPDASTFNIPDLRDRMIVGASASKPMAAKGGEATHLLLAAEGSTNGSAVTGADTPDHAHNVNLNTGYVSSDHSHAVPVYPNNISVTQSGPNGAAVVSSGMNTGGISANHYHNVAGGTSGATARHAHPLSARDADVAHNNMPPYLAVGLIVKVNGIAIDSAGAITGPRGAQGDPGKDGNSITIPIEPWHIVNTAGEPPLQNGWTGGGVPNTAFYKDPAGVVHVRGTALNGGSGTAIFTLPVGYRPPVSRYYVVLGDSGAAGNYVLVQTDGTILGTRVGTTLYFGDLEFDTETVKTWATGPVGPAGPPGPGGAAYAVQRTWIGYPGSVEAYTATWTTPQNVLTLTLTPTVPVWWEVYGKFGLVGKVDAAYNYLIAALTLTPADQDGVSAGNHYITQHSQVQAYEGYEVKRMFRLAAGTAYTVTLALNPPAGGQWQYYQGRNQTWLDAKAWAQ